MRFFYESDFMKIRFNFAFKLIRRKVVELALKLIKIGKNSIFFYLKNTTKKF